VRYHVRVYEASAWSLFTQADHYEDFTIESNVDLPTFAKTLAREGFPVENGNRWIMPGAIIWIKIAR
jgi:hypothetical protein